MKKTSARDDDPGFRVYVEPEDIPRYQRAWVWGTVTLLVLLCGILIGWLLKPGVARIVAPDLVTTDAGGVLAAREAVNRQLRDEIARLEALLSDGACVGESSSSPTPGR